MEAERRAGKAVYPRAKRVLEYGVFRPGAPFHERNVELGAPLRIKDTPMRIHVVTPVTPAPFRSVEDFREFERDGITVTQGFIDNGPASIECEFDEAMALPDTLRKIMEAAQSGADAIVVDCLADPAVKAARELVSIPVVGPGETSMHWAALLAGPFSVVTVLDSVRPMIENIARLHGLDGKLKSIRVVDIPVLELEADKDRLYSGLGGEAIKAVREDGARGIVLGCTGMLGCAAAVEETLKRETGAYIPVLDPVPVAIMQAISFVRLGNRHSKLTYATPPEKPLVGYNFPNRAKLAAE